MRNEESVEKRRLLGLSAETSLWSLYPKVGGLWRRIAAFGGKLSGSTRKRRREQLQLLARSGLFDERWYLTQYPDVAADRLDPLLHFYDHGWREGRDPGPHFATSAYLKGNADVARSGMNPLLHYIEHGQSEGRPLRISRRARHPGPAVRALPSAIRHQFPAAAPVYRGDPSQRPATPWERSYRLSVDDPRMFTSGGRAIGIVDGKDRAFFKSAFARLARSSGLESKSAGAKVHVTDTTTQLTDAWYINEAQLRTRWQRTECPFVVRAYQHSPETGQLAVVGEALLASPIDRLDASLVNPWFPVLFVIGEPGGRLRDALLLAFPSLCRGGLHYPELLALSPDDPDPVAVGLVALRRTEEARGNRNRFVGSIAVDVGGADGTSPLFDAAFRSWLSAVADVHVHAAEHSTGPAAGVIPPPRSAAGGGSLVLGPDMIPTLHALGLIEGDGDPTDDPIFVPLVVAGSEPSQPATLVELPPTAPAAAAVTAASFPSPWPRFVPTSSVRLPNLGPLAIRLTPSREPRDAELLVPASAPALEFPKKSPGSIAWLLFPREWQVEDSAMSLQALSLQEGAETHNVILVGSVDRMTLDLAITLFGDRVTVVDDPADLATALKTEFVGYLGGGVVLHDPRSAAFLLHFLDDASIASASCALLSVEARGKGWHVSVADIGMPGAREISLANECDAAEVFWRSTFPVGRPPKDFWIARSSAVKSWAGRVPPQPLAYGVHLCTTLISASYLASPRAKTPSIHAPPAKKAEAVSVRALYG